MGANEASRLVLTGFLLLAAFLFLLLLGPLALVVVPVGLVVLGFLLLAFGGDEPEEAPERVNCADCGAPNATDADECRHCGASL